MVNAYRKKASDYDFEDYLNDELRKTSLTRQDEMKFCDGLTANESINMARKYNIITREVAMEYRRELKGNSEKEGAIDRDLIEELRTYLKQQGFKIKSEKEYAYYSIHARYTYPEDYQEGHVGYIKEDVANYLKKLGFRHYRNLGGSYYYQKGEIRISFRFHMYRDKGKLTDGYWGLKS